MIRVNNTITGFASDQLLCPDVYMLMYAFAAEESCRTSMAF
jgi:hypothetical protein